MTRERRSRAESKNCEILLLPTADRRFDTKVKCPTGRASFLGQIPRCMELNASQMPGDCPGGGMGGFGIDWYIKYHSFDAPWSLGRKSVFCTFLRVLYRVHDARSAFYTWVHILYPVRNALVRVLYLSACFVLFSTFPAMQYQICFFLTFSHLRNFKKMRSA